MQIPSLGPRGEGWVAAQLVLFVLIGAAGLAAVAPPAGFPPFAQLVAGAVLIVVGGLLAVRGVLDLGANLTPFPHPRSTASLVEFGAYRFVRHPIYSGIVVASGGWSLVTGSLAALLLTTVLLVLFDAKSRREEAWLQEKLPGYAIYRRRTRKFVPGIY